METRIFNRRIHILVILAIHDTFQEDKEPLFDVCDTLRGVLQVATGTLITLQVRAQHLFQGLSSSRPLEGGDGKRRDPRNKVG